MAVRNYGEQDSAEFANQYINIKIAAVLFGVSHSRISQMVNEGSLHFSDESPIAKRFKLKDVITEYINYRIGSSDEAGDLKIEALKADVAIKKSRAEREQIQLDELRGKMHRSSDVKDAMDAFTFAVRSCLVALPGRLAVDVAEAKTAAEASQLIRKEISAILKELSNFQYDPEFFASLVAEREGLERQVAELVEE